MKTINAADCEVKVSDESGVDVLLTERRSPQRPLLMISPGQSFGNAVAGILRVAPATSYDDACAIVRQALPDAVDFDAELPVDLLATEAPESMTYPTTRTVPMRPSVPVREVWWAYAGMALAFLLILLSLYVLYSRVINDGIEDLRSRQAVPATHGP